MVPQEVAHGAVRHYFLAFETVTAFQREYASPRVGTAMVMAVTATVFQVSGRRLRSSLPDLPYADFRSFACTFRRHVLPGLFIICSGDMSVYCTTACSILPVQFMCSL